jgi:polar amino acid transport system substrate-binding protein
MKKNLLVFIAIGLLSLLFAAHVSAGMVMERILEEKVLRVGTTGAQPPMTATTKGGELIGMDVDLAKAMASAMGVEVKFVTMPFEKLLPAVETGVVDMVVSGLTMTPKRNRTIAFVGPYYVSGKGILGKSSKYAQLQQAEGLNAPDVTVAVLKGSTSQEFAEQLMPKAKKIPATSYEEAIGLLRKDEADVMVADYPFCALTAYRNRAAGMVAGKNPLTFEPLGIAMPEDTLLINWVRNFLSLLQGTGQLKDLQKKWLSGGSWIEELP